MLRKDIYLFEYMNDWKKLSETSLSKKEDTTQFNEDFMKSYYKESDEGYFIEVDVQYSEQLHELHNDLPFFLEERKFKKWKSLQLIYMKKIKYVIHMRNLKQALNHRLFLKKNLGVIKFNQNAKCLAKTIY